MAYVLAACLTLLLVVFGWSTVGKVRSRAAWSGFAGAVRDLRLVPAGLVGPVAAGTVASEATVVLLVAVPATVPVGLVLAGCLLAVFSVSILAALRRGARAVCRCFGQPTALPLGGRHVLRNGLLLAVVGLGGLSWTLPSGTPHPAGLGVAAAAGLVGAVLLIFFDEIVDLFAGPPLGAQLGESPPSEPRRY